MLDLLLKDILSEIKAIIENLGGRTPKGVKGILVVKRKDEYLVDFLMGLLGLSECWIVENNESIYAMVRNIRKCQRCRVVIGSTRVNRRNQKDIGDAVDALRIKTAVVKNFSVFALEDNRLKKDKYRVIVPGANALFCLLFLS